VEAARLDGSPELRIFTISIRLMGWLVTILLFQFVAVWNKHLPAAGHAAEPAALPVTLGLYIWNSQITQRFWRGGLASGSIK
jgi:multiple sugar transport system permease protein